MSLPGNGIFVLQGEMAMLVTAMRRSTRWGSHSFPNEEYDVLMRTFQDLKLILNQVGDLRLLDPATYLSPFLEVIRSKETTGPVTSLALSAIHKFLSYGLIDPTHPSVPATVEDIADAVTHARFVGTDHSSDGVVLMKILQVLRTLMLSPEGAMLTDESVCEIMLSCFRICFETRLTELLRRNAEQCLRDMTQLIFMRLPQFPERAGGALCAMGLSLKKRDKPAKRKSVGSATNSLERKSKAEATGATSETEEADTKSSGGVFKHTQDKNLLNEAEITIEPVEESIKSPNKKHVRHSSMDLATNGNSSITLLLEKVVSNSETVADEALEQVPDQETTQDTTKDATIVQDETKRQDTEVTDSTPKVPEIQPETVDIDGSKSSKPVDEKLDEVYVNNRGIRFTPQDDSVNLQPYGLVCVRELFRFLISLCNPLDTQNTSAMVHLGLCLVGTALEVGADQIAKYPSLLELVKDPLCRNLISLLSTERISIFALDLQVSFLLFEALRCHLKFQMEAFFKKIIEIISTDTTKSIYELKEIHHLALEYLAQMFRIPGLCTELFLNYDCDIYCMNVFEELTKLLSKNVVSSTAYNIHSLSLEALMTAIEATEAASSQAIVETGPEPEAPQTEEPPPFGRDGHVSLELGGCDSASVCSEHATHHISLYAGGRGGQHSLNTPSDEELQAIRNTKKWVVQGTELFNQKPERGVEYLQQHGVLSTPLDPHQLAMFLRENPDLDKKMIGEYICKRSNLGEEEGPSVLAAFADSFDFAGLRIDQALRLYLETFRLPGEAPLIFLVMERFAERWHSTNGEPFANTDAAFRLAYAVIMLNMDQHNHNAKKLNVPMTVEDFVKNLRGCNGSGDFSQPMLEAVFQSIKSEEMIMPAERVGPVRDAYLWRVLQRRDATTGVHYVTHAAPPHALFALACPSTVTALSAAFERASPPSPEEIATNNTRDSPALYSLNGLERCAALLAKLPADEERLSVDTLLLTLCKFTGLLSPIAPNYIAIGVTLGQSPKAQLSLRRACGVAARHGDCVRDAWRHMLEILKTLYIARLLPKFNHNLMQSDPLQASGAGCLISTRYLSAPYIQLLQQCLVEVEDYLAPSGAVSLIREARGSDAGLLSSLYSYIALGESGMRTPSPHEKALIEAAADCVSKCNLPALLVYETKFLHLESLQELIRAMVTVGTPPDSDSLQMNPQLEDNMIFFLELLGQTLIQNRDRVLVVWDTAGTHIHRVILWSSGRAYRDSYAISRALPALLRSSARLMRSEHCASPVLQGLKVLFQLPYKLFYQQADVIACGLYELIKTSAQNVHSAADWQLLFSLLTAAGAGAWPNDYHASATSSRSEGSEDESDRRPTSVSSESELSHSPHTQGWILVHPESGGPAGAGAAGRSLRAHRASALARCCEALALVVRDVAHVTPHNCRAAAAAAALFVRATLHGGKKPSRKGWEHKSRSSSGRSRGHDDSSDEEEDTLDQYHLVSIQLLDLMHTLHSRTAQIFRWWKEEADQGQGAEDYDLWEVAWMPLLQGIAQFCTDRRKQVANSAIAYLQRALLAPGLAAMGASCWEACFQNVLFPLMERLPKRADTAARANTIMCKVFLHHLSALSSLGGFAALWLRVVSLQLRLVSAPLEPLTEAATESLKNMILVMDSVKIFSNSEGYTDLWYLTWEKIDEVLPNLHHELFPEATGITKSTTSLPIHLQTSLPASLPTLVPVSQMPHTPTILPVSSQNTPFPAGNILQPNIIAQPPNIIAQSPNSIAQTPNIIAQPPNIVAQSPNFISQTPNIIAQSPNIDLIPIPSTPPQVLSVQSVPAPAPVSGMVPIRNTLYAQGGLTSSVLLQPLNEMISTPIGTSMNSQMPILYPTNAQPTQQISKINPIPCTEGPTPQTIIDFDDSSDNIKIIQHREIYAEYLNNPYNETEEVTAKETTLYDPESNLDRPVIESLRNPLLNFENQKSFSADNSPLHRNKTEFGSSDNVQEIPRSGMFNFSSYFGMSGGSEVFDNLAPGSEVFDSLVSTDG